MRCVGESFQIYFTGFGNNSSKTPVDWRTSNLSGTLGLHMNLLPVCESAPLPSVESIALS